MKKFSNILKSSDYIFEKNNNVVESFINYCEDIMQELIDDLLLINLMESSRNNINWTDFWQTEGGWYCITKPKLDNDEFFNQHYFNISIELCINKKVSIEKETKIDKYITSIRKRIYTQGYVTTYEVDSKPNGYAILYKISVYGK